MWACCRKFAMPSKKPCRAFCKSKRKRCVCRCLHRSVRFTEGLVRLLRRSQDGASGPGWVLQELGLDCFTGQSKSARQTTGLGKQQGCMEQRENQPHPALQSDKDCWLRGGKNLQFSPTKALGPSIHLAAALEHCAVTSLSCKRVMRHCRELKVWRIVCQILYSILQCSKLTRPVDIHTEMLPF